MLDYALAHAGEELSAPLLNRIAAGDGVYVSSFSKRVSECRAEMQRRGGDFVLARDEWHHGHRQTAYILIESANRWR